MKKDKEKVNIVLIRKQNREKGIISTAFTRNYSLDAINQLKEYELKVMAPHAEQQQHRI